MTKFQKSLACALFITMLFSMFFPEFTVGFASDSGGDAEEITVVENDNDVEYSLGILELLSRWFG